MSNGRPNRRRLSAAQSALAATLGPVDGARLPGGCDQCDAFQTVRPATPGVWVLTVHHGERCHGVRGDAMTDAAWPATPLAALALDLAGSPHGEPDRTGAAEGDAARRLVVAALRHATRSAGDPSAELSAARDVVLARIDVDPGDRQARAALDLIACAIRRLDPGDHRATP